MDYIGSRNWFQFQFLQSITLHHRDPVLVTTSTHYPLKKKKKGKIGTERQNNRLKKYIEEERLCIERNWLGH